MFPPSFPRMRMEKKVIQPNNNYNFRSPPPPPISNQSMLRPSSMHVQPVTTVNNADAVSAFSNIIPSLVSRPPPPILSHLISPTKQQNSFNLMEQNNNQRPAQQKVMQRDKIGDFQHVPTGNVFNTFQDSFRNSKSLCYGDKTGPLNPPYLKTSSQNHREVPALNNNRYGNSGNTTFNGNNVNPPLHQVFSTQNDLARHAGNFSNSVNVIHDQQTVSIKSKLNQWNTNPPDRSSYRKEWNVNQPTSFKNRNESSSFIQQSLPNSPWSTKKFQINPNTPWSTKKFEINANKPSCSPRNVVNITVQSNPKLGCWSPSDSFKSFSTPGKSFALNKPLFENRKISESYFNQRNKPYDKSSYPGRGKGKQFQGGIGRKIFEENAEQQYCCDTCDRTFPTESDYHSHTSQHVTCDIENCQFTAHPKIVAIHKKMQHDTGYADAINKLKNADEIAKWRAERKRRFPTVENIRKRKEEEAERIARGEVIETKEFGQFKRPNSDSGNRRFNKRGRFDRRRPRFENRREYPHNITTAPRVIVVDSDSDSDGDSHIKLHPFPGMLVPTSPKSSEEFSETNHSESCIDHNVNPTAEVARSNSLEKSHTDETVKDLDNQNSLESSSGEIECIGIKEVITLDGENSEGKDLESSDLAKDSQNDSTCDDGQVVCLDSDDDAPEEVPIIRSSSLPPIAPEGASPTLNQNDPEENGSALELPNSDSKSKTSFDNTRGRRFGRGKNRRDFGGREENPPFVPPVRLGLLEKLLADDIRHERNVIMQCIRHIVKNQFFGHG